MNPIFNAINQGFTPQQILQFLSQSFPHLAPRVNRALSSGYSINQILGFLSKSSRQPDYSGMSESQMIAKNRKVDSELTQKGLMAFGALAASPHVASAVQTALFRALPSNVNPNSPSSTPGFPSPATPSGSVQPQTSPIGIQPTQPILPQPAQAALQSPSSSQPPVSPVSPIQQQPIAAQAATIPQSPQTPQPQGNIQQITASLQKSGLDKRIEDLAKNIKDPKAIAGVLYTQFPKEMKAFQNEAGMPMEDAVAQYMQSVPAPIEGQKIIQPEKAGQAAVEIAQSVIEPQKPSIELQPEPIQPQKEVPKEIAKNETVLTPNGVGEVKSDIRNGKAIVEVDGKKQKVSLEDIKPEPEEVKKSTLDFDINSVPEELRSAPLNEVYAPADRRHVTVKYNQGLKPVRYIYYRKDGQPVPEEYIAKIKEGVQLPISSGLSFWGAWNANKADSRGEANYEELVRNAQEEGQPDDPSKQYWFVKEEGIYEHPYMEHLGKQELRRREKEFIEKNKKKNKK